LISIGNIRIFSRDKEEDDTQAILSTVVEVLQWEESSCSPLYFTC